MVEIIDELRSKILRFFIFLYLSGNLAWVILLELLAAVTYPLGGWSSTGWENALRPFSHISLYKWSGIEMENGSAFLDENGDWLVKKKD